MPSFIDMTGQRFASLVVVSLARLGPTVWRCLCDCGASADVYAHRLKSGNTKSCGCLKKKVIPLADRFWYRVQKGGRDECWMWTGGTNGRYGVLVVGGSDRSMVYAHRASYEMANGPITDDRHVMHSCDHPLCVNPAHLMLGTRLDNMADMVAKGRSSHVSKTPGEKNRHAKLTESDVVAIRIAAADGMSVAELVRRFGVKRHAIAKVVSRRTWKCVA